MSTYHLPEFVKLFYYNRNISGGSDVKESACHAGDPVRSLGREDPLEKEMATHSSILAWRIPWKEEPGGLQSLRFRRVGHGWVNSRHTLCYDNSVKLLTFG